MPLAVCTGCVRSVGKVSAPADLDTASSAGLRCQFKGDALVENVEKSVVQSFDTWAMPWTKLALKAETAPSHGEDTELSSGTSTPPTASLDGLWTRSPDKISTAPSSLTLRTRASTSSTMSSRGDQAVRAKRAEMRAFLNTNGFVTAHGAKITRTGKVEYPLHVAARQRNLQVVRLLVEFGADVSQRNSAGRTAEDVALRKNSRGSNDEVLEALRRAAQKERKPLAPSPE